MSMMVGVGMGMGMRMVSKSVRASGEQVTTTRSRWTACLERDTNLRYHICNCDLHVYHQHNHHCSFHDCVPMSCHFDPFGEKKQIKNTKLANSYSTMLGLKRPLSFDVVTKNQINVHHLQIVSHSCKFEATFPNNMNALLFHLGAMTVPSMSPYR